MAFIPFDNVAKLEAIFTLDGQRIQNVHHYWFEAGPTETDLQDLAAFYKTWFDTSLAPHLPTVISLVLIKVTDLSVEDGTSIEYATGLPITGDANSPALPNNCTMTIKWTTGRSGRSYRGRTYFPVLREDIVDANMVSAVYAAQILTVMTDLVVVDLPVNDCVMVVASRVNNGTPRVTGLATPVTNLSIDRVIDSQRRRLPGRGA